MPNVRPFGQAAAEEHRLDIGAKRHAVCGVLQLGTFLECQSEREGRFTLSLASMCVELGFHVGFLSDPA
jgi:hypothetical protein